MALITAKTNLYENLVDYLRIMYYNAENADIDGENSMHNKYYAPFIVNHNGLVALLSHR